MSEPQIIIMGCVPVKDDTNDIIPSAGSIKEKCEVCGGEVWLGLKQQEFIGIAKLVCYPCCIKAGMTAEWIRSKKGTGELGDLGGPTATIKPKNQDN